MVSIFLNPNNLGISMALMTFVYIIFYSDSPAISIVLFVNGLLIVFFSVSKTGLAVFLALTVYMIYSILIANRSKITVRLRYLISFMAVLPLIIFALVKLIIDFDFSKTRSLSWETLLVRSELNAEFIGHADKNIFFPWKNSISELDNMYFHLWGSFGLPALVLFLLFNLFLILQIHSKKILIFLMCFLMIGLTTNFLYLWPLGYFYWSLVSLAIAHTNAQYNATRFFTPIKRPNLKSN
jgi:hypothetical protein